MKVLSQVKKDMEFNRGLSSLVEILKGIAVSQYQILERKIQTFEQFIRTVESFFELLDPQYIHHPFIDPHGRPLGVMAITSDTGLLGGLNLEVVNTAIQELQASQGELIVVGERGQIYARERRISFTGFPGIQDEYRYSQAMELRDYVVNQVLRGVIGPFKVVYPRAISFTVQRVETLGLLPCSEWLKDRSKDSQIASTDVLMESFPEDIVEYLVYLWLGQKFYEILGWSRLAELAARFVHLEGSSQKLQRKDKDLRLEYFHVMHEIVDRSMRELFAARLLYGKG